MEDSYFFTNDGVRLHYIHGGQGKPLVIIHGYRSEAVEYCHNLEELSRRFTVYFLEHRGHGSSDRVDYGARLSRLSMDLHQFLEHLNLQKTHIMCHSMGALVVFNYIDLFGQDIIDKLIIIDVGPRLGRNPYESEKTNKELGGTFTDVWKIYTEMKQSVEKGALEFLNQAENHPDDISEESPFYQYSRNLPRKKQDPHFLASLILNISTNDFRDVVMRIAVPTMYIAGETSRATTPLLTDWYKKNISDLRVASFTREEYGRHSMFCANPNKFNCVVTEFLTEQTADKKSISN